MTLLGGSLLAACRTPEAPIARQAAATGATVSKISPETLLEGWPSRASLEVIGRCIVNNFAVRLLDSQINPQKKPVFYSDICAWYGALQVAALLQDQASLDNLLRSFDYFLTPEGARKISWKAHVEHRLFGALPLEIFMLTGNGEFLTLGRSFVEKQWQSTSPEGITSEARYLSDDLYMVSLLQVQAYRATRDLIPLDRAARLMVAYLDRLQQPFGLLLHSQASPMYWSRGNGWAAAGMTELLSVLPIGHFSRPRILSSFRKLMAALLWSQTEYGLWRQLIDQPQFWLETSGSGMFAFAMVTGVKQGWLEAQAYGPAVRAVWTALVSRLDERGNISDVCAGTTEAAKNVGDDPDAQREYYFNRPRVSGDLHGQGPLLWTVAAFLRDAQLA